MKYTIYIFTILLLFNCKNATDSPPSSSSERIEFLPEPDKDLREEYEKSIKEEEKSHSITCSRTEMDFLKLKEDKLQTAFFAKLDSIRKVQYPNNDQEKNIMVDLTPRFLNKFLNDINPDSLGINKAFDQEYHFNIAPKNYTDPKTCKDKISITFDEENCNFRLQIFNTFLVEPNWCTESMVIYSFLINDDEIIDFWRNEAG